MKTIVVVFLLLSASGHSFSQEWIDALKVARESYKNSDYKKALAYYQDAQKLAPGDVDLSDELGQTSYKLGDFEKSEQIFQENAERKSSPSDKAKSFHNIGNSRMQNKNYQGAADAYKESLRLNPESDITRYNLSEALRKIKKESEKTENRSTTEEDQAKDQSNTNSSNNKDGQTNPEKKNDKNNSKNESKLPNKSIDRLLNELMKKDAETKRKIAGNSGRGVSPKSGKDW